MASKLTTEVTVLDKFSQHIVKMNNTVSGFANNVQRQFQAVTRGLMAFGAAVAIGAGIKRMFDDAKQLAEKIETTALKYNLSTTAIQQWDYALRMNKSSIESAGKGFIKLQQNAYDANDGLKASKDAFDRLGVSIKNSDGSFKNTDQLSKEVIYGLAGVEDITLRTALANKLLGKAGQEMLPLLAQGAEGIKKLLGEADELGQVLDRKTILAITKANDAMDRFDRSRKIMGAGIVNLISEPLRLWSIGMTDIIAKINELRGLTSDDSIDKFFTDERINQIEKWTGRMLDISKVSEPTAIKIANLTNEIEMYENSLKGKAASDFIDGGTKVQVWIDKLKVLKTELKSLIPKPPPPPPGDDTGDDINKQNKIDKMIYERMRSDNEKEAKAIYDKQIENREKYRKRLELIEKEHLEKLEIYSEQSVEIQLREIEKRNQMVDTYVSMGEQIGNAFANGINKGNGSIKEALKGTLEVFLSFLERYLVANITENAIKKFGTAGIPGLLVAGAEAAAITAVFEIAKGKISSFATGTNRTYGGLARVHKDETIMLPRNSQVYNKQETRNYTGGSITVHLTDMSGNISQTITRAIRNDSSDELVRILKRKMAVN